MICFKYNTIKHPNVKNILKRYLDIVSYLFNATFKYILNRKDSVLTQKNNPTRNEASKRPSKSGGGKTEYYGATSFYPLIRSVCVSARIISEH